LPQLKILAKLAPTSTDGLSNITIAMQNGETNLKALLDNIQPSLDEREFIFCSLDEPTYKRLKTIPICMFRETEGITIIVDKQDADREGLAYNDVWALITLTVYSSLTAVGFLAAIANKLASAGISINPVAAYYHDHLFIPWNDRDRALKLLQNLGRDR
jgi:uncharacterized protein